VRVAHSARLVIRPLLVAAIAAAGVVAGAAPAAAAECGVSTPCPPGDPGGPATITAAVEVTIRVSGPGIPAGRAGTRTASVGIPRRCAYFESISAREAAARVRADPNFIHRFAGFVDPVTVADILARENEPNGRWYFLDYVMNPEDSSLSRFRQHEICFNYTAWAVFSPTGGPPPLAGITPADLLAVARDYMEANLEAPPLVHNAPAGAVVNLETWVWADPAEWEPTTVTAEAFGVSASTTATPAALGLHPHPWAAIPSGACVDGGTPWSGVEGSTDCSLQFHRAGRTAADSVTAVGATTTWTVTTEPATPPEQLSRDSTATLRVREIQVVGRNWAGCAGRSTGPC
jgi:hypothetical protein